MIVFDIITKIKNNLKDNSFDEDVFLNHLNDLEESLDTLEITNIQEFIHNNLSNLYDFYDTLVGEFSESYINEKYTLKCNEICEKLLISVLHMQDPNIYFVDLPNEVFVEFIKGIIHFEDQRFEDYDKLYIYLDDSNDEIERKRKALRRCYIIRKIYNILFKGIFTRNRKIDEVELNIVEDMMKEYYPHERINVQIAYEDIMQPKVLYVEYERDSKFNLFDEYYKKDDIVECMRTHYRITDNNRLLEYKKEFKKQSYISEEEWKDHIKNYP